MIHGSGVTQVKDSHLKGIRCFQGSTVLQCLQHFLEAFGVSDLLKTFLIILSHHMKSPSQLWQKVWRVCGVGDTKGNPLKGTSSFYQIQTHLGAGEAMPAPGSLLGAQIICSSI